MAERVFDMAQCGKGTSADGHCRFFTGSYRGKELLEGRCSLLRVTPMFAPLALDTNCRIRMLSDSNITGLMERHQIDANSAVNSAHASLEYRRSLDDVLYLRKVHGVKPD